MPQDRPDASTIHRLSNSTYDSIALLAGLQLGVFSALADQSLTAGELASKLQASPAKLGPLLYLLTGAGLLTETDDCFANSDEADHYLVSGRPDYIGDRHLQWSQFWAAALQTADTIRSGQPQASHDFATLPPGEQEAYFRALHPRAISTGSSFASETDLSAYTTILDTGCGSAGFAIGIARECPGVRLCAGDLPSVLPISRKFIAESDFASIIETCAIDILCEPVSGAYDAVILKNLLQVFSPEQAQMALRNVSEGIVPGGHIYVMGDILNDDRTSPHDVAGINLAIINLYTEGQAYTWGEYQTWLSGAGYTEIKICSDETIRATWPGS